MKQSWQGPRALGLRRGGVGRWMMQVALGAFSLSMIVACGDSGGGGALGELGAGTFDYRCENSGDLKCSETGAVDEFELGTDLGSGDSLPQAVAVGATFGIRYAGSAGDDDDDFVTVDSVSADDKRGPNVFAIPQPVEAAITATNSEGDIVDFAVITALEATELGVWHDQEELRDLSIDVGETVELTVAPRSESGTFLGGALPYNWRILDDSVAMIGELGDSARNDEIRNEGDIKLLGVSVGTTILRVRSGDLEAVVEVEVSR